MKTRLKLLLVLGSLAAAGVSAAENEIATAPKGEIAAQPADDAPLAFPPLEHYAKLWENSMFTTKTIAPPDTGPKGPIFTDNLVLHGTYEVDGAFTAVIQDKTTSGISTVQIGAENENGIKIVRVNPGATADKTRIQLQKGEEVGWLNVSDAAASPPAEGGPGGPNGAAQNPAMPQVPPHLSAPGRNMIPPAANGQPIPPRPRPGPSQPAMQAQPRQAAPAPQQPAARISDDVPLPPLE